MPSPEPDSLLLPENLPTVWRQLQEEAIQLKQLYQLYELDRKFLADHEDGRILYFIDSHDIKAFIDPDDTNNMDGFEIGVERLLRTQLETAGGLTRPMQVSLRHNQILNGLIFDPSSLAGVLPSHGSELDREVTHQMKRAAERLTLMRYVNEEIARIQERARRFTTFSKWQDDPDTRRLLVHFFQEHAPVLTAILRNDLDSPQSRLQALLTSSRVVAQRKIRWADLELPEGQQPFGEIAPSASEVNDVWTPLVKFRYRHNSARANVIDATALAHVRRLQNEMESRGHHHVRVLLVTRARTLLRAAIEMAGSRLDTVQVRHPRLLALASKDGEKLDSTAGPTLDTALQVYRAHLATLAHSAVADVEDLLQVSRAFLQAWDSFETSRLAMEAQWRGKVGMSPVDTERHLFQALLNVFSNERDASSILSNRLVESFDTFGVAASQFLMGNVELRESARLDLVRSDSRVQIAPLTTAPVGPIEVTPWPGSPTKSTRLELGTIAKKVVSPAERYLVWSAALACSGRWQQAGIFAQGAQRMAELEDAAGLIADEARLLRAEIRRLGAHVAVDGDDDISDDKARYERTIFELSKISPPNAARHIREKAAQVLEAVLRRVDIPGLADEQLAECAAQIEHTIDSIVDDADRARMIATLLSLHLAAEHGSNIWPRRTPSDRSAAYYRHRELIDVLGKLYKTGQIDALPHWVRALALIGFVCFGERGGSIVSRDETQLATPEPGPQVVPEDLRGDLPDLIQGLTECPDAIASLLLRELRGVAQALARIHSPSLLLAPIRMRRPKYSPRVAPLVHTVEETTGDVRDAILGGGINQAHIVPIERAIETFLRALEIATEESADRLTQFTLRSELQYFRLLQFTLRPLHLRIREAHSLVEAYEAITVDYREATVPHCRLSWIVEMCGETDRAILITRRALDLVDTDPFLMVDSACSPHWLQSLVRRRLAALTMLPAAQLRPTKVVTDEEMALQVENLFTALLLLRDAEDRDTEPFCDSAHLLERQRRANNIVYCVSRLLERNGGQEALKKVKLPRAIDVLLDELIPRGIELSDEPNTLHTVGCYFAAIGRRRDAYRAGKRILELIMNDQREMSGFYRLDNIREAMTWYGDGHPGTKSPEALTVPLSA